ncbi:guanine nucleotide-binding protein subunit beta-2-like isoform X1 [Centruroides sculpturatus]|uniref:guanine nucleotide-binding protein subunit beta-2-like isoform X1 n=2 Tax=Centruroides sculpturatus TaxID=218467 RepID=UPI000C6EA46E|nr:guanine nucleotide-binding protein subunit beta-2-like isoform X1 [Centruroides sculpturatus]
MAVEEEEMTKLKDELEQLKNKIKKSQAEAKDKSLEDVCGNMGDISKVQLRIKKIMRGHLSKVNAVHFSGDDRHLVSGSLDGKLIIWDSWTGNKMQIITLQSSWVMTAAYAPSGNFVACGGMDNMCTVYDINSRGGSAKIRREMAGFEGFLSCCRFVDDNKLITGSADMKIILWDLEKGVKIKQFEGHEGDVMSMSLHQENVFITGSVDKSVKLWDLREDNCRQTFWGHDSDVNSVCFHKSGYYFATGSEDKSSRLFDIRADQQIGHYKPPSPNSGFTSCGLSTSGRLVLCGSDDTNIHIWDTLKSKHNAMLSGHDNRITSLSISDNGMAVATCSWDTSVRLWN